MAMPQSIMVVLAGLSGAFNKTVSRIPSSGTCNHQGMPYRPHIPRRRCGLSLPWSLRGGNLRNMGYGLILILVETTSMQWLLYWGPHI